MSNHKFNSGVMVQDKEKARSPFATLLPFKKPQHIYLQGTTNEEESVKSACVIDECVSIASQSTQDERQGGTDCLTDSVM